MSDSKTPESDASDHRIVYNGDGTITETVDVDFARSLERRLALAEAKLNVAVGTIKAIRGYPELTTGVYNATTDALNQINQLGGSSE